MNQNTRKYSIERDRRTSLVGFNVLLPLIDTGITHRVSVKSRFSLYRYDFNSALS